MGAAVLAVLSGCTGADVVSTLIFRPVHRFNLSFAGLVLIHSIQIEEVKQAADVAQDTNPTNEDAKLLTRKA